MSSTEKERKRLTRRSFVKGTAAAVGAGVLTGCVATTTPPQVVKETVEVPVEVTKVVTQMVEAPAAAAKAVETGAAAGPVILEVLNPTSSIEVTNLFAPRLDTLEGKTICELAMEWQAPRTMPYIREVLRGMYPTAKYIGWEELPRIGGLDESGSELGPVVEAVKNAKCDAVIIGNAG